MTINEFIEELGKLRESQPWEILNGCIRYYAMDKVYAVQVYCPITAVCYSKLQIDYSLGNTIGAGQDLELHPLDRTTIINAADNTLGREEDDRTRLRILQALGLEEVSECE